LFLKKRTLLLVANRIRNRRGTKERQNVAEIPAGRTEGHTFWGIVCFLGLCTPRGKSTEGCLIKKCKPGHQIKKLEKRTKSIESGTT